MKVRGGQVAVYLVLALVAIAMLMLMNVSVFLSVRSKNRMMNAVDESALAVAKHQGDLLNRIGRMNVEHLRALIANQRWDGVAKMRELALFGPLDGIEIGNRTAAEWGAERGGGGEAVALCLNEHIAEILTEYCNNPDLYPEYRERQWVDYAMRLSALANGGLLVAPGFMETANAWSQEPLLGEAFYDAIAARAWCWFGLGNRSRYFDMDSKTMPRPLFAGAQVQENSEIYSLHVTFKTWMDSEWADEYVPGRGFNERWTNFVCQVTGCSRAELAASALASDPDELWAFYDGNWRAWSRSFNPENYPIAGGVKPEYDVAGCFASCLMQGNVVRLWNDDVATRSMLVTAEAKPLGTITFEGETRPVTGFHSFVAPSRPGANIFTEAQLVLMGSVPRSPGICMNPRWYAHVKHHLPDYFVNGPRGGMGCYYCRQLSLWEDPSFRAAARNWLLANGNSCRSGSGTDDEKGGYDCAH